LGDDVGQEELSVYNVQYSGIGRKAAGAFYGHRMILREEWSKVRTGPNYKERCREKKESRLEKTGNLISSGNKHGALKYRVCK
jgi:hypothetical protein